MPKLHVAGVELPDCLRAEAFGKVLDSHARLIRIIPAAHMQQSTQLAASLVLEAAILAARQECLSLFAIWGFSSGHMVPSRAIDAGCWGRADWRRCSDDFKLALFGWMERTTSAHAREKDRGDPAVIKGRRHPPQRATMLPERGRSSAPRDVVANGIPSIITALGAYV